VGPAELVAAPLVECSGPRRLGPGRLPRGEVTGSQGAPDVERHHFNEWPSKVNKGPHDWHGARRPSTRPRMPLTARLRRRSLVGPASAEQPGRRTLRVTALEERQLPPPPVQRDGTLRRVPASPGVPRPPFRAVVVDRDVEGAQGRAAGAAPLFDEDAQLVLGPGVAPCLDAPWLAHGPSERGEATAERPYDARTETAAEGAPHDLAARMEQEEHEQPRGARGSNRPQAAPWQKRTGEEPSPASLGKQLDWSAT